MPRKSQHQAIKVPQELHGVSHAVLEEYVSARLAQFSSLFATRIAPNPLSPSLLHQAFIDTLRDIPSPDYSDALLETRDLQLRFTHNCLNIGCQDPQCSLCEHCPHRRCSSNFQPKYLVQDTLNAKCNAPIQIELYDKGTDQPVHEDIPGGCIEVCIIDGHLYDSLSIDDQSKTTTTTTAAVNTTATTSAKNLQKHTIDECMLLLNNKNNALLVPGSGGTITPDNKILLPLKKGVAVLPSLKVTDSSEAILSGRRPPFRLYAKFVVHNEKQTTTIMNTTTNQSLLSPPPPLPSSSSHQQRSNKNNPTTTTTTTTKSRSKQPQTSSPTSKLHIEGAVSEGFVIATRRTKTSVKVDVPNIDDPIGKLLHMGKETVKKLMDLQGSAAQAGIPLQPLPYNNIEKVGQFRQLLFMAEADGHLRQKLQHVLKISTDKWNEAHDHAMRAVVSDNRMRIWYADFPGSIKGTTTTTNTTTVNDGDTSVAVGLFFTCKLGMIDLDRPVGLVLHKKKVRKTIPQPPNTTTMNSIDNTPDTMEAVMMAQQTPQQRHQVMQLHPQAVACWWQPGHPGWAIYPADSDIYLSTGKLEPLLPEMNMAMLQPSTAVAMAAAALQQQQQQQLDATNNTHIDTTTTANTTNGIIDALLPSSLPSLTLPGTNDMINGKGVLNIMECDLSLPPLDLYSGMMMTPPMAGISSSSLAPLLLSNAGGLFGNNSLPGGSNVLSNIQSPMLDKIKTKRTNTTTTTTTTTSSYKKKKAVVRGKGGGGAANNNNKKKNTFINKKKYTKKSVVNKADDTTTNTTTNDDDNNHVPSSPFAAIQSFMPNQHDDKDDDGNEGRVKRKRRVKKRKYSDDEDGSTTISMPMKRKIYSSGEVSTQINHTATSAQRTINTTNNINTTTTQGLFPTPQQQQQQQQQLQQMASILRQGSMMPLQNFPSIPTAAILGSCGDELENLLARHGSDFFLPAERVASFNFAKFGSGDNLMMNQQDGGGGGGGTTQQQDVMMKKKQSGEKVGGRDGCAVIPVHASVGVVSVPGGGRGDKEKVEKVVVMEKKNT